MLFEMFRQPAQVIAQRVPLRAGELVATHHADTEAGGVVAMRMRAHFVHMTASRHRAARVDHEVVADAGELRVLFVAPLLHALEAALRVPAVDLPHRRDKSRLSRLTGEQGATVRRIRTVNNDEFYFA